MVVVLKIVADLATLTLRLVNETSVVVMTVVIAYPYPYIGGLNMVWSRWLVESENSKSRKGDREKAS